MLSRSAKLKSFTSTDRLTRKRPQSSSETQLSTWDSVVLKSWWAIRRASRRPGEPSVTPTTSTLSSLKSGEMLSPVRLTTYRNTCTPPTFSSFKLSKRSSMPRWKTESDCVRLRPKSFSDVARMWPTTSTSSTKSILSRSRLSIALSPELTALAATSTKPVLSLERRRLSSRPNSVVAQRCNINLATTTVSSVHWRPSLSTRWPHRRLDTVSTQELRATFATPEDNPAVPSTTPSSTSLWSTWMLPRKKSMFRTRRRIKISKVKLRLHLPQPRKVRKFHPLPLPLPLTTSLERKHSPLRRNKRWLRHTTLRALIWAPTKTVMRVPTSKRNLSLPSTTWLRRKTPCSSCTTTSTSQRRSRTTAVSRISQTGQLKTLTRITTLPETTTSKCPSPSENVSEWV